MNRLDELTAARAAALLAGDAAEVSRLDAELKIGAVRVKQDRLADLQAEVLRAGESLDSASTNAEQAAEDLKIADEAMSAAIEAHRTKQGAYRAALSMQSSARSVLDRVVIEIGKLRSEIDELTGCENDWPIIERFKPARKEAVDPAPTIDRKEGVQDSKELLPFIPGWLSTLPANRREEMHGWVVAFLDEYPEVRTGDALAWGERMQQENPNNGLRPRDAVFSLFNYWDVQRHRAERKKIAENFHQDRSGNLDMVQQPRRGVLSPGVKL